MHAFQCPTQGHIRTRVLNILANESHLIVFSCDGHTSVFSIDKTDKSVRSVGLKGRLTAHFEKYFKLKDMHVVVGAQWFSKPEKGSLQALVASSSSLSIFDFRDEKYLRNEAFVDDPDEAVETVTTGPTSTGGSRGRGSMTSPLKSAVLAAVTAASALNPNSKALASASTQAPMKRLSFVAQELEKYRSGTGLGLGVGRTIATLRPVKTLQSFHAYDSNIHSISTAVRTSSFISCSGHDQTLRIWDLSCGICSTSILQESYIEQVQDRPNSVDLHPSGRSLITGSDDYITECAVLDNKLELLKRIPIKGTLLGPNDEPFVNSSPVSVVRFSHGGHLLAGILLCHFLLH